MNCPACGYYNPPSQLTCSHCSLPLPIPAGDAICAVHPGVKATGACSRCGTFGCGTCLTQRGTDWLCEKCLNLASKIPWDERESLGMWRAWWRTSVLMISSPGQTLATAEPDAPLGSSMLFALVSTMVGWLPTILMTIPGVLLARLTAPDEKGGLFFAFGIAVGSVLIYGFMILVWQLGALLFLSALDHLGLMLLGSNPKSLTVTVRAHALSTGTYLVGLLPVCSVYVFPLWSLVLRIIGLMSFHKTTAGKATAAVLIPVALFCGLIFAFYAAVIGLAMNSGR